MAGEGAPTATVTVLFNDLVGSTERQSRLGDDHTDEFRRRYFAALRAATAQYGGQEIKTMGDGMMVIFPDSTVNALASAAAMHDAVEALEPDDPAHLKVGISVGEARSDEGDWFGTPVNEAARLCAAAAPGQTLTTELVRGIVGSRGALELRPAGTKTLKGLPAPVKTVELIRAQVVPYVPTKAPKPPRRTSLLVAGLVGALLVVAAIAAFAFGGGSSDDTESTGVPPAKGYVPRVTDDTCVDELKQTIPGVSCFLLHVPENSKQPKGRWIQIGFIRVPATDGATGDPVLDFGIDNLATTAVRQHSDVIQIGQRGSGYSKPLLACPAMEALTLEALTRPANDPEMTARKVSAVTACRADLEGRGIDVTQYNLDASGDDMLDLIRALKLERVNLETGYVSTVSAFRVIRTAPGVVRTLTLSEPAPPGESSLTNPALTLSAAFNRYSALCRQDPGCAKAFPDVVAAYKTLQARYQAAPVIGTSNVVPDSPHAVLIDGQSTAVALNSSLYPFANYPLIAAGISSGSADVLAGQVLNSDPALFNPRAARGTDLSNTCSYELQTQGTDERALTNERLPEYAGADPVPGLAPLCAAWDVPQISDTAFAKPATDVPTLLIYGDLSPSTSLEWGDEFTQNGMSHGTVIHFKTLGQGPIGSAPKCLGELRQKFLADPEAKLDVAACEKQSPAIKFVTG